MSVIEDLKRLRAKQAAIWAAMDSLSKVGTPEADSPASTAGLVAAALPEIQLVAALRKFKAARDDLQIFGDGRLADDTRREFWEAEEEADSAIEASGVR